MPCSYLNSSTLHVDDISMFFSREEFDLVGEFLMEYGSGIVRLLICPLQASLLLSSKKIEPSPEGLRKGVLAKDAGDSQKPYWLLIVLFFSLMFKSFSCNFFHCCLWSCLHISEQMSRILKRTIIGYNPGC